MTGVQTCALPIYLNNTVLLLEDVDDKSYRFERMLLQLRQQPGFAGVQAVIFGQFSDVYLNHPDDKDLNQIIDEFAAAVKIPIIKNFPFGHVRARKTVPIGARVAVDAGKPTLYVKS